MITQTEELFFKPRWQRTRRACLIRKNEARIREFAQANKLPVLVIEGLARPVIGSGLWDPFAFICGVDDDIDWYELDESCGPGHIVWPIERYTQSAIGELSITYPEQFEKGWQDIRSAGFKNRAGSIIMACDRLGIPMRYYDAALRDLEIYIPMPPKRKRRSNVPYYLR